MPANRRAAFLAKHDDFPKRIYVIADLRRRAHAMLDYYEAAGNPVVVGVVAENVQWARGLFAWS